MENPTIPNQNPEPMPKATPVHAPAANRNWMVLVITVLFLIFLASTAFLYYQNQQLQKQIASLTTSPTASATMTPTPSPYPTFLPVVTANWKTYQDSTNRFSIKYPSDWKVSKQGGISPWIAISSPDRAQIGIDNAPIVGMVVSIEVSNQAQPPSETDLQQFENTNGPMKDYKVNTISRNSISIQGNPALRYEYEGTESPYLYHFWGMDIAQGSNIISISIVDNKEDPTLNTAQLADQILSTFTFTGNNQAKINCTNPRQQVCTMLCIQPPPYICGSDGKSYCSTCQACGNPSVMWYQMSSIPCGKSTPP